MGMIRRGKLPAMRLGRAVSGRPVEGKGLSESFLARVALLGVWALMAGVFAVVEPSRFLSSGTFTTIFGSQTYLVFLTLALFCTLLVGEFVDLSIASVLGLCAVIVPVLVSSHGWDPWLACVVAVLAGVFAGAINGFVVVFLGINPIVVTLGMSTFLLGVALFLTDMQLVSMNAEGFGGWVNYGVLGLPLGFWYGAVVVGIVAYVVSFTPLGRYLRAVGSNQEVSRLAGVRVNRLRFGAFVMAGLFAGVGGVLSVASSGGFDPNSSQTYLLPTFASVFLGTAVIEPGRFNPVGSFVAIYFLETGIVGLQLLGASGWISDVFYGAVLVVAVTISTLIGRRKLG